MKTVADRTPTRAEEVAGDLDGRDWTIMERLVHVDSEVVEHRLTDTGEEETVTVYRFEDGSGIYTCESFWDVIDKQGYTATGRILYWSPPEPQEVVRYCLEHREPFDDVLDGLSDGMRVNVMLSALATYVIDHSRAIEGGNRIPLVTDDPLARDIIKETHDITFPPDNVRMRLIEEILWQIRDMEVTDDEWDYFDLLDGLIPSYTYDLTAWLHSNSRRVSYIDDYRAEFGSLDTEGYKLLAGAYFMELMELYDNLVHLAREKIENG